MGTLLIALLSFVGFVVAYNTYGRYLGRRIFRLDPSAATPAHKLRDDCDYVPTRRAVLFGHHFTSIAGTGPIVGPAIAVFWGWLPALLWVLVGSIFIGAVHDFGSLAVSLRNRGHTIGDVAGRLISRRARLLFLFILFFCLTVVLAVFGLVVAVIFSIYPQSVLSVWVAMPLAVVVGLYIHRRPQGSLIGAGFIALLLLYAAVYIGARHLPITLGGLPLFADPGVSFVAGLRSSVVVWTLALFVYCFAASVLPVWLLLQPRDYINSQQLFVALILLTAGLAVARPEMVAPMLADNPPADAPPIFPFLFITIACGAVSGFHCLVSSGTTSKQLNSERDALFIGYGAMLLEGALAVLVIVACCAGLGMGVYEFDAAARTLIPITDESGAALTGLAAWSTRYGGGWASMKLAQTIGAFVEGGANMMASLGIPLDLSVATIAVMVACFAATTLDTATRLQRYVIQELGASLRIRPLTNKYTATAVAVLTGGAMALYPGPNGPGSGGFILWPLFGASNQLLAGLAFLVVVFYLLRRNRPIWFILVPLALMVILPAWAMLHQMVGWYSDRNWLLFTLGAVLQALQVWMVAEGALLWRKARGVSPEPWPGEEPADEPKLAGARS